MFLHHEYVKPGPGQVTGGNQPVVARAGDDHIHILMQNMREKAEEDMEIHEVFAKLVTQLCFIVEAEGFGGDLGN